MKIWTFTTTNNDEHDVKDNLTLKLKLAKANIKDWLTAQVKTIGKKNIESITLLIIGGSDKKLIASYSCSVNDLPNNIKFAQAAVDNDDTDSVEFSIETTGGNFIGCLTTAFDVDNKKLPKKYIVQGAEYNEPNGTLVPFAVTKDNFYAACKWVVNDFNRAAKAADRPERITLKEVMQKKCASSPASWGTNSWIKYTIVKEK
jgi:hypothetical protein